MFILIRILLNYTSFIPIFSYSMPSSHGNTYILIAHQQLAVTIFMKLDSYEDW